MSEPVDVDTPSNGSRKSRLVRSGATTVAGQFALFAITTTATIVLARILTPVDFGLVAMVFSLIVFISSFRDFGLPMAALQARTLDHMQSSALFWINVRITLLVTLLMILMAPVVAWFYGDPRLVLITVVMSAGVLAPALANQHEAQLTRQLRFTALVRLDVTFLAIGAASAIVLASLGAGHWALVAQFLIWQVGRAASVWIISGWRPAGFRAVRGTWPQVRGLVAFGANLTGFRVISHAGRDLDRILVGYVGGAHAMGLYDAALRWARMPVQQIYSPLLGVAVAGLSHVRDNPEAYRRNVRAISTPVLGLSIPILAYAAVAAEELILLLLGGQWVDAIPLFRVLCIGTMALAAFKTTKWLYVSRGDTRRQLRWGLGSAPLFAGALAAGASVGVEGVAIAYAAAQWVLLLPGLAYCLHGSPVGLGFYLRLLARPLIAAGIASAGAWTIGHYYTVDARPLQLLLTATVFGPGYIACWLAIPGGRQAARDVIALLQTLRPGRSHTGQAPAVPAAAEGA